MTESSKFTRREVIAGVTMTLLPPVAGAADVPSPEATLDATTAACSVGAAGAIANAIYHATGKRVRALPSRIQAFI
jgi:CO/xanthine dehydrogenase Mo-binding subunit